MRLRSVILVLLSSILGGCITIETVEMQPLSPSKVPADELELPAPRMAVIGNTSALRLYDDAGYAKLHRDYVDYFAKSPTRQLTLTIDDLKRKYIGFTRIQLSRIPGIAARYVTVLVPRGLAEIEYENRFAAGFQSSADLVAAVPNEDGYLTITKLLCRRDENYSKCSSEFAAGIYDASGSELQKQRDTQADELRIDPVTFKILKPSTT